MRQYDPNKKRLSYNYFRGDFLINLAILIVVSVLIWVPFYLVEAHHHAAVENQAQLVTAQNHFWQAVAGQTTVNPNSDLERFVADITPELKAAEKSYKPTVTSSLPVSITSLITPNKKYNDLAFQSKEYIWGQSSNGSGDFDPTSYDEGGKFSQTTLNGFDTIIAGNPTEISSLTHAPVPNPGNSIPPIPGYMYAVWFVVICSVAYVIAAIDTDKKNGTTFFSIARVNDAPKGQVIVISICAFPVTSVLWYAKIHETTHYKREGRKLIKELTSPDNPLADEIKEAQAIVAKYKGSKFLHLPEVAEAFAAAQKVLDTATYAAQHQAENEARKSAIDDMEALIPIAERSAEFHNGLHQEMQEHAGNRLTEIGKRFQNALGVGDAKDNKDDDNGPPASGGPITPEIVD